MSKVISELDHSDSAHPTPSQGVLSSLIGRAGDRRPPLTSYLSIALLVILIVGLVGVSLEASHFPDLRVMSVWFSPATVNSGESLTVTTRIGNAGHTAATQSIAQFYLSSGKRRSGASILLRGNQQVPGLDYSQINTSSTSVIVPSRAPAGTYYVLVCADDAQILPESNERNNCRASTTQLTVMDPGSPRGR